jgi:hypothetical protein
MLPEGQRETYYLVQYRILTYILFRPLPYIKLHKGERFVEIQKMSQMVTEVGYRTSRIRRALQELERLNIIHDVKFAYNKASFYIEKTLI